VRRGAIPAILAFLIAADLWAGAAPLRAAALFRVRPASLALAPDDPAADELRDRHARLRAHVVYEELLPLPVGTGRFDVGTAQRLLRNAPTLGGIVYRDDSIGFLKTLFRSVEISGVPRVSPRSVTFTARVDDFDFGAVRFESEAREVGRDFSFEMVNIDPIRFLFFPAVRPGRALVDILYFEQNGAPYVYVAWSVRATIFFSAVADPVERNLRARASVLKDWFIRQLEVGPP